MKRTIRNRLLKLSVAAALSGSVLAVAGEPSQPGSSGDLNASLHGSYAITTKRTCVNTNAPNTIQLPNYIFPDPTDTFDQSSTDNGIITFNGDGTGSVTGTSTTIDTTHLSGTLVTISTIAADVQYTVNPDGSVVTQTTASFSVIFPFKGASGTVTGQTGRLQIADDGRMLISAPSNEYSIETVTFSPTRERYRICNRSVVATKIQGDKGE